FLQAGAAEAGSGSAVGLVEAGLEDEVDAKRGGDFLELAGDVELQLHGLDHARAGDQEDRLVEADVEATELHGHFPGAFLPRTNAAGRGKGIEKFACA